MPTIPAGMKGQMRCDVDRLGVDAFMVYPDLDGLGQRIADRLGRRQASHPLPDGVRWLPSRRALVARPSKNTLRSTERSGAERGMERNMQSQLGSILISLAYIEFVVFIMLFCADQARGVDKYSKYWGLYRDLDRRRYRRRSIILLQGASRQSGRPRQESQAEAVEAKSEASQGDGSGRDLRRRTRSRRGYADPF